MILRLCDALMNRGFHRRCQCWNLRAHVPVRLTASEWPTLFGCLGEIVVDVRLGSRSPGPPVPFRSSPTTILERRTIRGAEEEDSVTEED
jgi:hypothetical protein